MNNNTVFDLLQRQAYLSYMKAMYGGVSATEQRALFAEVEAIEKELDDLAGLPPIE